MYTCSDSAKPLLSCTCLCNNSKWYLPSFISPTSAPFATTTFKHRVGLFFLRVGIFWDQPQVCSKLFAKNCPYMCLPSPVSHGWAKQKKSLVHAVCTYSLPKNFWEFGSFHKITLTPARHADFSRVKDACYWPCSVWTMTREQWRHSDFRLQDLLIHLSISVKRCGMWLMSSFPLKFTDCLEQGNLDCY